MASLDVQPMSGLREPSGNSVGVDRLPEEMNDMKIRDDKVSVWFICLFHILQFFYLRCFIHNLLLFLLL
jgi:hypothetical protein